MQVVNVRQLKSNPSTALKSAKTDMVVVMNRDKPDALIIGFEQLAGVPDIAHVRQAMAVGLFNAFPEHIRAAKQRRDLEVEIDRIIP